MHLRLTSAGLGSVLLLASNGVFADASQTVDYVSIRPGIHKMKKTPPHGEALPLDGPIVRVFSKDGKKYHFVGNINERLKFKVDVKGACKKKRRLRKARISAGSGNQEFPVNRDNKTFASNWKTLLAKVPYAKPNISLSPAAACNHELQKRLAQGKSRQSIMANGFVVSYPNAYRVTFALECSNRKVGFSDPFKSTSTKVTGWLSCEPSPHAGDPKKGKPANKPTPPRAPPPPQRTKPEPKRVPTPFFKSAALKATPKVSKGKCPAWITFEGKFKVNKSGEMSYSFVGDNGYKSETKSIKFSNAGEKTVYRKRRITAPTVSPGSLSAGGPAKIPVHKGWVAMKFSYPTKKGKPRVHGKTKKIAFEVDCNKPPQRVPSPSRPSGPSNFRR